MTKETQTVWRSKRGHTLIVAQANQKFNVPVAQIDLEDVEELREALTDILNSQPPKAEPQIAFKGKAPE